MDHDINRCSVNLANKLEELAKAKENVEVKMWVNQSMLLTHFNFQYTLYLKIADNPLKLTVELSSYYSTCITEQVVVNLIWFTVDQLTLHLINISDIIKVC